MNNRAIVAGHGDFAKGIISAAEQITGRQGILVPFTNHELCREEIEACLDDLLKETGATFIFTDLPGGSVALASRKLMRTRSNLTVVTAVNLPALIDFVLRGDANGPPASEVVDDIIARGRTSLAIYGPPGVTGVSD